MAHGYKAGDKSKMGKAMDLGLSSQSSLNKNQKLRGENTNRPSPVKETVSSDRGTFSCRN
jgi:hypothetical protein